jgi:hypothetical protein
MKFTKGDRVRNMKSGEMGEVIFCHEAETLQGHLEEMRIRWDDGNKQMYSAFGPIEKAPFDLADVEKVVATRA